MNTPTRDPMQKWAEEIIKHHGELEPVSTEPGLTGYQNWNGAMHGVTSALSFVAQAVLTDSNSYRPAMQYIQSDNGHLIGTDGRRLHIIFDSKDMPRFANGLWEVIKRTKSLIQIVHTDISDPYPPWRNILPNEAEYNWHELHFPALTGSKENKGKQTGLVLHELFQYTGPINTHYLEPLFCDRDWQVGVDRNDPLKKAVWFRSDNLTAIIAPIGLNK